MLQFSGYTNLAETWEDDIAGGNLILQPSPLAKNHTTEAPLTSIDGKNTLLFLRAVLAEQGARHNL
jgi:hypothetical protein